MIDGETGLLYPYGDIETLTRQLLQILRDDQLRDRFRRNALEFAGSLTWEKTARITLQTLEEQVVGREAAR